MSQTTRSRRRLSEKNGRSAMPVVPPPDDLVRAQAQTLDLIFQSLGRRVLVDDDVASELPLGQLRVCLVLFDGPRSMTQLSRELGVSQSAITQIADRLQSAGMVTRLPGGPDRRVRSLQLTTRARKTLQLRAESRIKRIMLILKRMSPTARNKVLASMTALRKAASDE